MGILAAIAIPNFISYRQKAQAASVRSDLQLVVAEQHAFHDEHNHFAQSLAELGYMPASSDVQLVIVNADNSCFQVKGRHIKLEEEFWADCRGLQD